VPALAVALGGAARIERTVYPETGFALVDVLDPSVGKADAVAFLQQRWGVSAAQTLAIGDNWNDRAMLEAAGLGLPQLPTNDEDGVAHALETHVLS
jgi:hydroxymethylpyrimidine pyrophosphatase-like HAD family hydrolase